MPACAHQAWEEGRPDRTGKVTRTCADCREYLGGDFPPSPATTRTVNITVSPAVARALDALALPGEKREHTVARIVWAFGTCETREPEPTVSCGKPPRSPR